MYCFMHQPSGDPPEGRIDSQNWNHQAEIAPAVKTVTKILIGPH